MHPVRKDPDVTNIQLEQARRKPPDPEIRPVLGMEIEGSLLRGVLIHFLHENRLAEDPAMVADLILRDCAPYFQERQR
jgi:hypothetical protein